MKLKTLFKKHESEKKEKQDSPPKDFHPGRPTFWELLRNGNTIKFPVSKK